MKKLSPQELEDRLIDFAVAIIDVTEALPILKQAIIWPVN
jgi:hypothetical protein